MGLAGRGRGKAEEFQRNSNRGINAPSMLYQLQDGEYDRKDAIICKGLRENALQVITRRYVPTPPSILSKCFQIESYWVEKQQRAKFQNGGDHRSNMFRIEFFVGKGHFMP